MKRRSFLALLGAAPVAAPVALREASSAAGIKPLGYGFAGEVATASGGPSKPGVPWVVQRLMELDAPSALSEYIAGMDMPSRLDPDLASSRSFSLSAAMLIQRRRDAERALARSRRSHMRDFREQFGCDWGGVTAWLAKPLTGKGDFI